MLIFQDDTVWICGTVKEWFREQGDLIEPETHRESLRCVDFTQLSDSPSSSPDVGEK